MIWSPTCRESESAGQASPTGRRPRPSWARCSPMCTAETLLPAPETLPPTERRRTGRVVRLAFAIGLEATRHAEANPAQLPVVFASSGGDGDNCHEICQTLASADRSLSPTRFHNSVHNAPAGYWSIAAGTQVPSTTICAYDASFAAGLLETLAQIAVRKVATALFAYDLDYPPPLRAARSVPAPFGLALVLHPSPQRALACAAERQHRQRARGSSRTPGTGGTARRHSGGPGSGTARGDRETAGDDSEHCLS